MRVSLPYSLEINWGCFGHDYDVKWKCSGIFNSNVADWMIQFLRIMEFFLLLFIRQTPEVVHDLCV